MHLIICIFLTKNMACILNFPLCNLWKWKWSRSVMSDSLRPVDCSPPSSSVHGILQARILEWLAISFSRGSSWPRDQTQFSHIAGRRFNLCTTREALKYKNPSTSIKDFKGGKEARLKEEGGGGGRGGQKGWPYRRLLAPADTQALWDFTLGLQRREDWNSALPETRIRVLCQEEVISLQSSAQAEGPSTRFLHPGLGD